MKWVSAAVIRGVLFALGWLGLSGGSPDYLVYGIISVILCTALSLWLLPPGQPQFALWPRRALAGIRLITWFGWQSAKGGVDVALRAVRSRVDIDPAVVHAPLRLTVDGGLQAAIIMMTLMPGSLVQRVHADGDEPGIEVHTISRSLDPVHQWDQLQIRVAAVFEPGGTLSH